jgi:hypothetical protein
MSGQVGDAPDGVALDFDVGREHLTDQGLEASELNDRHLVLSCVGRVIWEEEGREGGEALE